MVSKVSGTESKPWELIEQDVWDGISDEDIMTWADRTLLWPAIGRLAQHKLVEYLLGDCPHRTYHQHRYECSDCMDEVCREIGLE